MGSSELSDEPQQWLDEGCELSDIAASPGRPCAECPWRTSNMGIDAPDVQGLSAYTREQRARLWTNLRSGETREGCHMGAADREKFPNGADPAWIEAGFAAIPDHARPRECGGAVAAGVREAAIFMRLGSLESYQRLRPFGFSRTALELWLRRIRGDEIPGYPPLRDVESVDVVDIPTADAWSVRDLLTPGVLAGATQGLARTSHTCSCDACVRHGEVHPQVARTIGGKDVQVDAALAPLLDAMAEAGIDTTASCANLSEIADHFPEVPVESTFARVAARAGTAFVTFVESRRADGFLAVVQGDPETRLTRLDGLVMTEFELARADEFAQALQLVEAPRPSTYEGDN